MPSRVGREVTRHEGGYEEGEDACARGAAGVTVGCQGIVTLPDTTHDLGIAAKPARIYTYRGSRGHQLASVPEMRNRGEPYPHMISIASTPITQAEAHRRQSHNLINNQSDE